MPFKNVIYSYPLSQGDGRRLREGAGRRHAEELRSAGNVRRRSIERLKLEDGVRAPREHEGPAGNLRPRERQRRREAVHAGHRPDTTHASAACCESIEYETFFEGRYKGKVIQVHSSQTRRGRRTRRSQQLLTVEDPTTRPRSSSTSTCSRKAGT